MMRRLRGLSDPREIYWVLSSVRGALPLPPPLRPRPRAVVAERVVALADRLPEAGRAGAGDEVEPFLRVARDAVEERAEHAAGAEAHILGGLVAEELQHDELARRHLRHAARERERVLPEAVVRHRLEDEADARRLGCGDLVARQQIALRALEPQPVDPHRRGRRA